MNIYHRILPISCCLVLALCATAGPQERTDENNTALQAFRVYFDAGVKEAQIIGGSVVVVNRDGIVFEDHQGYANADTKQPITRETIYNWGSITKVLTAIAVMQLQERGLLDINDSVTKYLPEFAQVHSEYGPIEAVTLRNLLTHTSGYLSPDWPWRNEEKLWQPFAPTEWNQFAARLPYAELAFEPGTSIRYSNAGAVFLARIIERLTNESYEMYIDKNIFSPLEMRSSFFSKAPYYLKEVRSHSYGAKDGELSESEFDFDDGLFCPNGGWNGSVEDMVKFLRFIIGTGSEAELARYEFVLPRETLKEMWVAQFKYKSGGYPYSEFGREVSNALGIAFFLQENFGIKTVGHSGGQEEFSTWFHYDVERDIAYATAFNSIVYEKTEDGGYVPKATFFFELGVRDYLMEHIFPLYPKLRTIETLTLGADYYKTKSEN